MPSYQSVFSALRTGLAALALHLLAAGSAQAGLVTGSWDPQFGPTLPGMSWQVKAEVLVPDACSNKPDGIYTTSGGDCDNGNPATFQFVHVWLRLFDTGLADANDFFGFSAHSIRYQLDNYFTASSVRVEAGQIVGFNTNSAFPQTFSCYSPCDNDALFFSALPSAEGNLFQFYFTTNGPELICLQCATTFAQRLDDLHNGHVTGGSGRPDVASEKTDLQQFLVTNVDDGEGGQTPKFTDSQGRALGARLGQTGSYLGQGTSFNDQSVPEPSGMWLALIALAGLAGLRTARRHAA